MTDHCLIALLLAVSSTVQLVGLVLLGVMARQNLVATNERMADDMSTIRVVLERIARHLGA